MVKQKDPSSSANVTEYKTEKLRFDWTVNFDTQVISGTASLFMVRIGNGSEPVILDVRDLNVDSVKVAGSIVQWKMEPTALAALGSRLIFSVPRDLIKFEVEIAYKTSPESSALQWLDSQMTADKRLPFMFSQCQAIHARSLFPCQDTPCVKSVFDAVVHAPKESTVVMGGVPCGSPSASPRGDEMLLHRFEQNVPIPSYLVTIACGDIASRQIGPRSTVWAEPSVVDKAARVFFETEQMLSAAEHLCGPYRWGVYDILVLPPSFPYGGMENPCLTFVSPTILAEDRSAVNVIAHEIAHSWTGNLVTNTTWEHFWLNEGHTVYLERLIMEELHGEQTRQLLLTLGYSELVNEVSTLGADNPFTKLVPHLDGVDPDIAYNRIPYEKGSLLLYFIETIVGKSSMLKWLKAYVDRFASSPLDTDEWLKFMVDQFKSQLDSVPWDKWFNDVGLPAWLPKFEASEMLNQCDQLVDIMTGDQLITKTAESSTNLLALWDRMNGFQHELALRTLVTRCPLASDKVKTIDAVLHLSTQENAEFRFQWSMVCVLSRYLPALESCFAFLNSQGRMKYTRPLYREMNKWAEIKSRVHENYKSQLPYMHRTTASLVKTDIGA